MIEEISDKSRTPNRIFSKQVNNFNSIPSVPSVPNVTPKDPNDFVEEFTSEPFGSLTIQGVLAHNSYSSKYQSISGRSDVEAPALVRDRNSPSVLTFVKKNLFFRYGTTELVLSRAVPWPSTRGHDPVMVRLR